MIKDVSIPEFFPKVERGASQRSKADNSGAELLSSSADSSSSAPVKDKKSLRSFDEVLKSREAQPRENDYKKRSDVSDGSQPQQSDTLEDKVTRRGVDSEPKKELESKAKKNVSDFVMPEMFPASFATPKRSIDTSLIQNDQIPEMANQQLLLKQEAVSEFVEDMQTQFGISPEQIMAAFAQLSPQVLAAPASESTEAFVNELPLAGDQKVQAAALYEQMLQQTGDQVFSEQMMGNPQTSVGTDVLSKKEYNQQVIDQSLKELNQKFFQSGKIESNNNNGKIAIAGMTAVAAQATAQNVPSSQAIPAEQNTLASFSDSGDAAVSLSPKSEKSSAAKASAGAAAAFFSGMTSALGGSENQSASSNDGGSNWSSNSQQQQASQTKLQPQIMAVGAFTPEIAKASSKGESKDSKSLKGDDLLAAMNTTLGSSGLTTTKLAEALGPAAMLPGAVQPSENDKASNIQQLIKQAQVIIKQGGGEMKVEMSPEGMGKVNLKVAVENGQVNIQMVAHNKETKKMIEEGMSELKASLAEHKLKIDHLKVDLSQDVSKQMQEQLQDHQREQAREFAQNFLGNMRDERQGFRQGFFENSAFKSYKQNSEREGGVPQPAQPVAGSAKKKQTDRRLDMVA